jgi:hypothetical protein
VAPAATVADEVTARVAWMRTSDSALVTVTLPGDSGRKNVGRGGRLAFPRPLLVRPPGQSSQALVDGR